MAWLIYDEATGAELERVPDEPVALMEGQAAALVPGSAEQVPALTVWSAAQRGWIDAPPVPMIGRMQVRALFSQAEWIAAEAVALNPAFDIEARASVAALLRAVSMIDSIAPTEPYLVDGVALFAALGVISPARAAEVLAQLGAGI